MPTERAGALRSRTAAVERTTAKTVLDMETVLNNSPKGSAVRTGTSEELRLIVDRVFFPSAPPESDSPDVETIRLPSRPGYLIVQADGAVTLAERPRVGACLLVEPIHTGPRPQLLAVTLPDAPPIRFNGHPATRVRLLRVGDQLLLGSTALLHVTVLNRPQIGVPSSEQLGVECPLCRTPIARNDEVFTCSGGCTLHHTSAPVGSDGTVLECAKVASHCPSCMRAIVLEKGLAYVPELD